MSNSDGFGGVQTAYNFMDLTALQLSKIRWPMYAEPKYDGIRCIIEKTRSGMKAHSRLGNECTSIDHILRELEPTMEFGDKFDGEVMSKHDFNTTSGMFRQKHSNAPDLYFILFDVPSQGFLPLVKRKEWISAWMNERMLTEMDNPLTAIQHVEEISVNGIEEVFAAFKSFRSRGLEGLMLKDPLAVYHPRRNKSWLKMKDRKTTEGYIVDAFEGEGKYVGMLGGFILRVQDFNVSVGSGLDDGQRMALWKQWKEDPQSLINQPVEFSYHEETGRGSLRHPIFERFRPEGL